MLYLPPEHSIGYPSSARCSTSVSSRQETNTLTRLAPRWRQRGEISAPFSTIGKGERKGLSP